MKVEHCEICHHKPSRRMDAELRRCDCKCHDVADAAPQLLAACKEVAARLHDQANEMICQNLMAESDFLREMRDLLLLAARNAENSPDCS